MENSYTQFWLRLLHTPEADAAVAVAVHGTQRGRETAGGQAPDRGAYGLDPLTPDQAAGLTHLGRVNPGLNQHIMLKPGFDF